MWILKLFTLLTVAIVSMTIISECYAYPDVFVGIRTGSYALTIEKWAWDGGADFSNPEVIDTLATYNTGGSAGTSRGAAISFSDNALYIASRWNQYLEIEKWSYDDVTGFSSGGFISEIYLGTGSVSSGLHGTTMEFANSNVYIGTLENSHLTIQKLIWDGEVQALLWIVK